MIISALSFQEISLRMYRLDVQIHLFLTCALTKRLMESTEFFELDLCKGPQLRKQVSLTAFRKAVTSGDVSLQVISFTKFCFSPAAFHVSLSVLIFTTFGLQSTIQLLHYVLLLHFTCSFFFFFSPIVLMDNNCKNEILILLPILDAKHLDK